MDDTILAFISHLPFAWAKFGFMQQALLAILIVTPLFAFLGCTTVNNQMAFFSDAIGHSALTGIAIGTIIGIGSPTVSMVLFAVILALLITILRKYAHASADTIIGIVMACTIAVGIMILSRNGGFSKYSRYLIGDFLSITSAEIVLLAGVFVVFALIWTFVFNSVFLMSSNSSIARSRRVPVWVMQGILAVVVAVIVSLSIPWIGMLVINALLILPASIARNISRNIFEYHWIAVIVSVLSGIIGLIVSFYSSTATGATIVVVLMFLFVISLVLGNVRKR